MLRALHKSASSKIVKILLLLLIMSFCAWGITDYLRYSSSEEPVITVGNISINKETLMKELDKDISRLQSLTNVDLTVEDVQQMGLLHQTIDRIVSTSSLDVAANIYGLSVPDELLAKVVKSQKSFQNSIGQFSYDLFQKYLLDNKQTERAYLETLRKHLLRIQVSTPFIDDITVSTTLINYLYRYYYEKRVAEVVTVPITAIPQPAIPDKDVLEKFYKNNATTFSTPEYRTVSVISLNTTTVTPLISPQEERVREIYENSAYSFTKPETRIVDHILFTDLNKARDVLNTIQRAKCSLSQISQSIKERMIASDRVLRSNIEPSLGEAIFTAPLGTVIGPVESTLGWYLLCVTAVEPESVLPLEQVRSQIRKDLILEMAEDTIYKLSNQIEDGLNDGLSLEEIAHRVGVEVVVFGPLDRRGLGPDGYLVPNLQMIEDFLPTIFELSLKMSVIRENIKGFFVVRVNQIIPPYLQPLESVHQALIKQWLFTRRQGIACDFASILRVFLENDEEICNIVRHNPDWSIKVEISDPLSRFTTSNIFLPPTFLSRLLILKQGETIVSETQESFIIGRVQKTIPPTLDQTTLEELQNDVEKRYIPDILTQFTAAIKQEFPAVISWRALEGL